MPREISALEPKEAAEIVVETIMKMAEEAKPLMTRILPEDDIKFWEHYPDNDAIDKFTTSRWYYHVHADGQRDKDEHGHFHLFLDQSQLDNIIGAWSEPASQKKKRANVVHVAALSIDHSGIPRKWMITNRWITDEWLYPAEKVIAAIPKFNVDKTPQDKTANRFITAMVALYRDEIAELLHKRDEKFAIMGASTTNHAPYHRGSEVMAELDIDLDEKLESLGIE